MWHSACGHDLLAKNAINLEVEEVNMKELDYEKTVGEIENKLLIGSISRC